MSETKAPIPPSENEALSSEQRENLKQGIAKIVADRVQAAQDAPSGTGPGAAGVRGTTPKVGKPKPGSEKESVQKIGSAFVDFQPDAIELEVTPVPGGLRWVLYTVTLFLLTAIAWAYWTKIETFVVAQGKLVPISEPVLIQATAGSPIRQIHVRFGDVVRAGQLLATLDATVPDADVQSLTGRLFTAEAKLARLTAEQSEASVFDISAHADSPYWQAEAALFRSRQLALESQLAEISAEIEGFEAKIQGNTEEMAGLQEALAIHLEVEEKMRVLAEKNVQPETTYLSQKLNRQETGLKINNLINQNKQLQHDLAAARKRQERAKADRIAEVNEKIVETSKEAHVLRADLDKANRMKELSELRVPTDLPFDEFFVLEASERTTGSVVRETDPLFKLMPLRDPLRIEAEVAGKDIGEIRLSDLAIIKLDALPYQKHGTLKGHLATISEGAFEKKEGEAETTFFKAFVTLDDRTIQNQPANFRIVPGMTCKVELKVGSRRVIDYFLYPLFRHMDESLREPSQRTQ
ncbi:MAG: HlyD family type I secretion periplasmic adaptor subunit [Planctomycetaceae bacterium]|nr:HlyD family type I secretion periplasmic adaptor subunit [Planctomycetaceae bacterium]